VAVRLLELLDEAASESAAAQQAIADKLGAEGDALDLQQFLSDPEALLADLLTPGERATSAQLAALTSALGGYVDHVTAGIAARLTGSAPALTEAWYRYRITEAKGEQGAGALFGLDLSREQVDRGAAFVRGVVERAGEEGLARLWSDARALPTPPEVDARGSGSSASTCPTWAGRTSSRPERTFLLLLRYSVDSVSSGKPRSHSSVRFSRSASRTTRSRLRRNWGSWGGSSTSRARARSRNVSMVAGSPKSDWTSQWGATGPR